MKEDSAEDRKNPWHQVTAPRLQDELDRGLIENDPDDPYSRILAASEDASIRSVLTAMADPELLGAIYGSDSWWEHEAPSTVLARIPAADVSEVVLCWVLDSMASGEWSLNELHVGDKGYVFYIPDFGIGDREEQPLLGGWKPVEDRVTRRECLLRIYEREWRNQGYPPSFGQWAIGDTDILLAGIRRALDGDPKAWGLLFDRLDDHLKRFGGLEQSDFETVAHLIDLPLQKVRKVVEDYLVEVLLTGGQLVGGLDFAGARPTTDEEKRVLIGLLVHCVGQAEP